MWMKTLARSGVALTTIWLFSGAASAVPMLDQSNDPGPFFDWGVNRQFFHQQTFTVGLPGLLTSVDVFVARQPDTTENLFVGLYSTLGGSPSALLSEVSFLPSEIPSGAWLAVDFTSAGIVVGVGDLLAIGLRSNASNDPPYNERYYWTEGFNYSAGGHFMNSAASAGDLSFRTYVDAGSVPEPATLALLGLGLAGLGFSRRKR